MAIVIGIDPGSGVSSDTGFAAFDSETGEVIYALEVGSQRRELRHRLADISSTVSALLTECSQRGKTFAAIESFVMRGKGGETLQRLIGAFMATCPDEVYLTAIQNTTIKKVLAGHGHADKASVAIGVLQYFETELPNKNTAALIKSLISSKQFDILDALAIGVSAWQSEKASVKFPKSKVQQ